MSMTGLDLPSPAILHGHAMTDETHDPADKVGTFASEMTKVVMSNGVKTAYYEDEPGLSEVGKSVDSSAACGDAVCNTYDSMFENTDATTKEGDKATKGVSQCFAPLGVAGNFSCWWCLLRPGWFSILVVCAFPVFCCGNARGGEFLRGQRRSRAVGWWVCPRRDGGARTLVPRRLVCLRSLFGPVVRSVLLRSLVRCS